MYGYNCSDCGRYPGQRCCFEVDPEIDTFAADDDSYLGMLESLPENHRDEDIEFDIEDVSNEDGTFYRLHSWAIVNGVRVRYLGYHGHGSRGSCYDDIEAFREVQTIPMEERYAYYHERGF